MSEWISVKDRLPEESSIVDIFLVVVKTHGGALPDGCYRHVELASFMEASKSDKHFPGNTAYWELDMSPQAIPFEVTHWMPVPGLPFTQGG